MAWCSDYFLTDGKCLVTAVAEGKGRQRENLKYFQNYASIRGKGGISLFGTTSSPLPGLRLLYPGIKRLECEAEQSSPPTVMIKKAWVFHFTLPTYNGTWGFVMPTLRSLSML
jgi:hypothetical protein